MYDDNLPIQSLDEGLLRKHRLASKDGRWHFKFARVESRDL